MRDHTHGYQGLVAQGVCTTCKINPVAVVDGKKLVRCRECSIKLSDYQTGLYRQRTKAGTCRRCEDKPLSGQTLCKLHHNMAKDARARFKARRRDLDARVKQVTLQAMEAAGHDRSQANTA